MSTLVVVEHDNKIIHPSTRNILSAASQLGSQINLVVIGWQCAAVAEQAAMLQGVNQVFFFDDKLYEHAIAERISFLLKDMVSDYQAILFASTTFGKNIAPRVAAYLDVAQISDVSKIISSVCFEHPIYAGNAIETVESLDPIQVLTIRSTAFEPVTVQQSPCPIQKLNSQENCSKTEFLSQELNKSVRPDLSNAKIVVSGGRALQNKNNFKLIEELADCLGAAVGASRAAVDAGYVPNDYQVGQTGKVVAPSLYIAVGISGAVQHLAGMKDSKVIVAINKDADAPIFQIADYGVVGDLFTLIPEMITEIKKL